VSNETTSGGVCAIIVAAGRSERMAGVDKLFSELMGRPLLAWTLAAFKNCDAVDDIVVVTAAERTDRVWELAREWRFDSKVAAVIAGGATRQASVRAGLEAADGAEVVVVHDGARPLVTTDIIERGIALARDRGAALCAVPVRDTVKIVEGNLPIVRSTLARETVWLAQTPQCFDRELLLEAHRAAEATATDDAALVEALGRPVAVYEGATTNLKVTTPEDLVLAETLMRERFARLGER
jgi:2-C-methyl-D-erythritol 4-phosphate cytidylyltransferase